MLVWAQTAFAAHLALLAVFLLAEALHVSNGAMLHSMQDHLLWCPAWSMGCLSCSSKLSPMVSSLAAWCASQHQCALVHIHCKALLPAACCLSPWQQVGTNLDMQGTHCNSTAQQVTCSSSWLQYASTTSHVACITPYAKHRACITCRLHCTDSYSPHPVGS